MYASDLYGSSGVQSPSYGIAAPTQHASTDDIANGWKGLVDPANPLMWFGVVLLVTVGLAGVAGSVRIGKAKVSATVGEA